MNIDNNLEEKLLHCCETKICVDALDSEFVYKGLELLCQGDRTQNKRILYGSEGYFTEVLYNGKLFMYKSKIRSISYNLSVLL